MCVCVWRRCALRCAAVAFFVTLGRRYPSHCYDDHSRHVLVCLWQCLSLVSRGSGGAGCRLTLTTQMWCTPANFVQGGQQAGGAAKCVGFYAAGATAAAACRGGFSPPCFAGLTTIALLTPLWPFKGPCSCCVDRRLEQQLLHSFG